MERDRENDWMVSKRDWKLVCRMDFSTEMRENRNESHIARILSHRCD